jgi:acyl-ACP thioesterase
MRVADFTTGSAKLREALKVLRAHWEDTQTLWHDAVARQFEEEHLAWIEPQVVATVDRMNRLAQMVNTAMHECGPD